MAANIIGTAWHPALIGEAGNIRHAYRRQGDFAVPIRSFHGFFVIAALCLLAEYEFQDQ
jgi:hypothetical protein